MSDVVLDRGTVLVIGAGGQLGSEFTRSLRQRGVVHRLADLEGSPDVLAVDLSRPQQLAELVSDQRPAVVINAAAYTAVDRAEEERELALAVNARAPEALAAACAEADALLVHFSTDYVFDGRSQRDYVEQDPVSPINHYGLSKARGEAAVLGSAAAHLVFRTSWLYTPGGRNFVATMLRLFAGETPVRVVDDQVGCPTWARPLAERVLDLLAGASREHLWRRRGLYHLCGGGATDWHGFAGAIREMAQPPARAPLEPTDTAGFAAPAPRPARSVLDCALARERLGLELPHWREQLAMAMPEFNAHANAPSRDDG